MVKLYLANDQEEIGLIAQMANSVWWEYYREILSEDQIAYMLDKFQSVEAMLKQIKEESYQYYIIKKDDIHVGYTAIKEDGNKLFLSKLYLLSQYRGLGYGSQVFQLIEALGVENNNNTIWLTVNKYNQNTIGIYKKKGFKLVDEVVTDIGNNYVMDDYVFEKKLTK